VLDIIFALDIMKCTCVVCRICVNGHINVMLNIVFNHMNVKSDIILLTYIIMNIVRGIRDEM